jgi:hypothetical protein
MAYWDSLGAAPFATDVPLNTWVSLAMTLYTANGRPAVKFSAKPDGGSFVSTVRNDTFWGGLYDTFTNPRIMVGGGNGASGPLNGLVKDVFVYPSAITSDGDIQQQMDSATAQFGSLFWKTGFRGYLTHFSAIVREAGSSTVPAWDSTGASSLSVDNGFDDTGPTAPAAVISGGGALSRFDSLAAPSAPTGLAVSSFTGTRVVLTWTPVAGATEYLIFGRRVATEVSSDLYQSITGQATASITIDGLDPRIQYGFRIASINATGQSALSSEVLVTTRNMRIRCRTIPGAAGLTGMRGAVFRLPAPGAVLGDKLMEFSGLSFEPSSEVDPADSKTVAVLYIPINQLADVLQTEGIEAGDTLYVSASNTTKSTRIMDDAIVQEV